MQVYIYNSQCQIQNKNETSYGNYQVPVTH